MSSYDEYLAGIAPPAPQSAPDPAPVPAPAGSMPQDTRKGFPVFGIPALIMLTLMVLVFVLEILASAGIGIIQSPRLGRGEDLNGYAYLFGTSRFIDSAGNSLLYTIVQLAVSAALAAAICAIFYAMKKPGVLLTFACMWLIPFSVPYFQGIYTYRYAAPMVEHLLSTVLQTTSLFCFCGGLFAYLNLRKKGKIGGGPYFGLLLGVLFRLLSSLTLAGGRYDSIVLTLDRFSYNFFAQYRMDSLAAVDVVKIVFQVLLALAPVIVLSILARRKSTKGKTPLTVLWIFLVLPVLGTLAAFLGNVFLRKTMDFWVASLNTLILALLGGSFGGLIAYSFIHLLRRVPAFLYGLFTLMLALTMNCLATQYNLMYGTMLMNTFVPQTIFAAFDARLVILVAVLAYALRSYTESRPGSLALAVALLAGAFVWGDLNVSRLYSYNITTVQTLLRDYAGMYYRADSAASAIGWVLLIVPPVLMGAGAALLLRRALKEPRQIQL